MGQNMIDEECDLNYAVGAPVKKEVQYAMSNSHGIRRTQRNPFD